MVVKPRVIQALEPYCTIPKPGIYTVKRKRIDIAYKSAE